MRPSIWLAASTHAADELRPLRKEYKTDDEKPAATFKMESTSVAAGVGVTWGEGTLTFQGKEYPFTVKGLSIVDIGVAKVTTAGDVFRLTKVEDFAGTYAAAGAGAAAGGGAGVVALTNQNGVKMKLQATAQGVRLTAAGSGITIKLKN